MSDEFEVRLERSREGHAIVRLQGDIDLRTSPRLREMLLELVERRPQRVIVDLTGVPHGSGRCPSGLAALFAAGPSGGEAVSRTSAESPG
jgi:anti-anti-sigma factor